MIKQIITRVILTISKTNFGNIETKISTFTLLKTHYKQKLTFDSF
jgi:hypothetical protein